jgi:hypothetical protein
VHRRAWTSGGTTSLFSSDRQLPALPDRRIGVTCQGCRQDQSAVVLSHLSGVAIVSMLSMSSAAGRETSPLDDVS